jgi:hypothetical protein
VVVDKTKDSIEFEVDGKSVIVCASEKRELEKTSQARYGSRAMQSDKLNSASELHMMEAATNLMVEMDTQMNVHLSKVQGSAQSVPLQ